LASVKLARLLSQDMSVCFVGRDGGFIDKYKEKHFGSYDIEFETIDFKTNLSIKLIFAFREIVKSKGIKNIIFLGASEMKSLYFSCLGLDVNFIIRQGSKKSTPKTDWFHRLCYSDVKYFVANSEYIKNNIKEIFPIPQSAELLRIYSSLKIDANIKQHAFSKTIKLVIVGRIHPNKGQLDAIKALEILAKNGLEFELNLLGDIQHKEYYAQIQQYLKTTTYKDSVNFVGYTTEVKNYLLQSDVFILSSLGEGMSNAIIEALGYGLVTLIYNDTSSPEFKEMGFYLHLTKQNNVENLKMQLIKICQNIVDEKKNSYKNIKLAQEVFAPSREKREYMELIV